MPLPAPARDKKSASTRRLRDAPADSRSLPVVSDAWSAFGLLWTPAPEENTAGLDATALADNLEAQRDELTAVAAIYESELRIVAPTGDAHPFTEARPELIGMGAAAEIEPIEPIVEMGAVLELAVALDAALSDSPPVARVHVPPALRAVLPRDVGAPAAADAQAAANAPAAANAAKVADGDDVPWPVASLPPLYLRLRLPRAYPSHAAPVFGVRCPWLTDAQLGALVTELDGVCVAAAGGPVICELVEWLRTDALTTLGEDLVQTPLELPKDDAVADSAAAASLLAGRAMPRLEWRPPHAAPPSPIAAPGVDFGRCCTVAAERARGALLPGGSRPGGGGACVA